MMAPFEYQIERGELVIFRLPERVEIWRGSFDEGSVVKMSAMPGSDGCAVVLFGTHVEQRRNLLRVATDGSILWRAATPPGEFGYSNVWLDAGKLYAFASSGYLILLDSDTGTILEEVFTK